MTSQTLSSTKYGTKDCNGPRVSYGKTASSAKMIAEPPRNIGAAGAILIHFVPK
ncbi:hypothetical protein MnTg01_00321 [archaeon MnTg01]|nr:hypothetical protein MnTg01_00321 [archaeon MnTg01]